MPESIKPRAKRLAADAVLAELRYQSATESNPMASPQSRRSVPLGEFPKHMIPPPSLSTLLRFELGKAEGRGATTRDAESLAPWKAADGTWQPTLQRDLMDTSGSIGHGSSPLPLALALRPENVLAQAGAIVAEYPQESDMAPAITTGATTSWVGNGETVAAGKLAFSGASLGHSLLVSRVGISRRLMLQMGDAAEAAIRAELQAAIRNAIEAAAFTGAGGVVPLGLLNSTAITSGSITATPTAAELVTLAEPVLAVAPASAVTIFLASTSFSELTSGTPVVLPVQGETGAYHVAGIRCVFTAHVPAGRCIAGDFGKFTLAFYGPPTLIVDPYSQGASGQVALTAQQHIGFAARHTASFRRGLS
jgi:hypothetical protein